MASDEHRDDIDAEPDEPTAHAEDTEPEAPAASLPAPAPEPDEPTLRDAIASARDDLDKLVTILDSDVVDVAEADTLLDRAHVALVACLDGPRCPMCQGDGLLAAEPPADPHSERCADCDGQGTVYTGSRVPESATRPCRKCSGSGFTDKATVHALPPPQVPPVLPVTGKQFYDSNDPSTWHLPMNPAAPAPALG